MVEVRSSIDVGAHVGANEQLLALKTVTSAADSSLGGKPIAETGCPRRIPATGHQPLGEDVSLVLPDNRSPRVVWMVQDHPFVDRYR